MGTSSGEVCSKHKATKNSFQNEFYVIIGFPFFVNHAEEEIYLLCAVCAFFDILNRKED